MSATAVFQLIDKSGSYAVSKPTGADPAMVANLDFHTLVNAVVDGQSLLSQLQGDQQMRVNGQMVQLGNRLSELVSEDL